MKSSSQYLIEKRKKKKINLAKAFLSAFCAL
jgi:hypothetical protein